LDLVKIRVDLSVYKALPSFRKRKTLLSSPFSVLLCSPMTDVDRQSSIGMATG